MIYGMFWLMYFAVCLILGVIGAAMADTRKRSTFGGFVLGFGLGIIGLAIIALMGSREA
jgi:succinate-acetate transporter protein